MIERKREREREREMEEEERERWKSGKERGGEREIKFHFLFLH